MIAARLACAGGSSWSRSSREPPPVNLFDVFWKELTLIGARVYEPADYERGDRAARGWRLPVDALITAVEPLDGSPAVFGSLSAARRR